MRTILGATVAVLLLAAPAQAGPAVDHGYLTGVAGSTSEARSLPCGAASGSHYVGAACFPKRAAVWHVDQPGACTVKSDVTTAFRLWGNCVLWVDEGSRVKVWAPAGAVDQEFSLVWG
jgi:hypothetical protein